WQPAPDSFAGLQVCHYGQGYLLGFRGVMSDELCKRLKHLSGDNQELSKAIDSLCRASRQEKAGRFLGRYLNTVKEIFPYVYVFTSNKDEPQASRDTFVVVCSLKDLA